jgi:hypothetical protein
MPLDPSIASGGTPIQIQDPVNRMAALLQAQGLQQSNQINAMKMQQQQIANDRQNKLYSIMGALPADATDEQRSAALKGAGFFDQADVIDKNAIARQTAQSEGQAKKAKALADFVGVQKDLSTAVMAQPTLDNAMAALQRAAQYHKQLGFGDMDISGEVQALQGMTSPDQIKQWAAGHSLNADKLLPKLVNFTAGNREVNQSIDPLTGKATETGSTSIGQSPDNAATIANQLKLEGIRQAGENARLGKTLAKDFAVAGLNPDGSLNAGNSASLVDMLGNYQLDPKQALARAPLAQRASLIAQVQAKYPGWDETTYDAKKGAASKFTYGDQGNALRSFAVAGQHLDQLGGLVDALDNGNMQIVNKLGNAYAAQTGSPAPTNFDAAKDVVSKEVMKAIVGGGGGVAEREELAKSMQSANSPAQLKGVIAQYRGLMSAQHDALLQQRRAAGLSDSTLPKYSTESAPAGTPPDIAALLAKHGGK